MVIDVESVISEAFETDSEDLDCGCRKSTEIKSLLMRLNTSKTNGIL